MVLSSFGLVKISSGRPDSTTTPSFIKTTRSATLRAKFISCHDNYVVCPTNVRWFQVLIHYPVSKAEVGSSSRIALGCTEVPERYLPAVVVHLIKLLGIGFVSTSPFVSIIFHQIQQLHLFITLFEIKDKVTFSKGLISEQIIVLNTMAVLS